MKWKALWLALVLCAFALPAQAQYQRFNDPAITSGTETDFYVLSAASATATVNSKIFNMSGAEFALFKIRVTTCTGPCNIQFQIQIPDPEDQTTDLSGTWFIWDAQTAITATTAGTYYWYGCTGSSSACSAGNMTGPPTMVVKPMPKVFRVSVVWNSGTLWSGNVTGVAW